MKCIWHTINPYWKKQIKLKDWTSWQLMGTLHFKKCGKCERFLKIKPKAFFINPSPEHEEHPISKKLFPTY